MAQILIESKPVVLGERHLYLVFRDDAGVETVIRGGSFNTLGFISVQDNVPIEQSQDARGSDTPQDRGSTVLNLGGRNASDVWRLMMQQVENIGAAHLRYDALVQNSNSVITSVLNAVGITIEANLPVGTAVSDFPALFNRLAIRNSLIGGSGADVIQGWTQNDTLYGMGGIDYLIGSGGNDRLEGGADADTLDGGDGADTLVGGTGDDILIGGDGDDTYLWSDLAPVLRIP